MVVRHNRRGYHDWLVQRISAVIIAAYAIFMMSYLACHAPLTYHSWRGLFDSAWMRFCTIIVLLSVIWHAWVGLWTVFTDYVKNARVRMILETLTCLLMLWYLIWCLDSLWR